MDIVKVKPPTGRWARLQLPQKLPSPLAIAGALGGLVLIAMIALPTSGEHKLERSKILTGTVQRGELKLVVDGYGVLRSQKQTLLTALTSATVQEVVLRPGAQVTEDSVILRMNNPEVEQQVQAASIALFQEKANQRRLALTNQRELLTEQSRLAELTAAYDTVTLRREAEEGLAAKGVIPQITFRGTLLQQEQARQSMEFQKERIAQLKKVAHESEMIQQKAVEQSEASYHTIAQRGERLTVRAGIKGELQRLPVSLGQSVNAGQELALVGSDQDLVALVRVSQSRAEQLQVGQPAEINTRRETVPGTVTRITPEVRDGTIEVEIAFVNGVPASARPELNVDARIFTANLKDALYIERPVSAQSNSTGTLFKLDANQRQAQRQAVSFGGDSGKYIQILSGASEKDHFILSDTSSLRDAERVQLVD